VNEVKTTFDEYITSVEAKKDESIQKKAGWLKKLYKSCQEDSVKYKKAQRSFV
jgi:hypothetical protein